MYFIYDMAKTTLFVLRYVCLCIQPCSFVTEYNEVYIHAHTYLCTKLCL